MVTREFTYQQMLDKIINKERFDFARYGDGEWTAILQRKPMKSNTDNHRYFEDMGRALLRVLESQPTYYIAIQSLAIRTYKSDIERITSDFKLVWSEANILHKANIKHRLNLFFDALATRDVLLVGPQHLYKLAVEQGWYFIEVPTVNCWLSVDETRKNINALISHKDWVVLYCASMMSNVLIDDFREQVTQIDAGSIFDPFVGVKSRRYHFNL